MQIQRKRHQVYAQLLIVYSTRKKGLAIKIADSSIKAIVNISRKWILL